MPVFPFLCPYDELVAYVPQAVVVANSPLRASTLDELPQRADYSVCRQREVRINNQAFPSLVIDDVEKPVRPAIR